MMKKNASPPPSRPPRPPAAAARAESELLFKGVTCALIGLVIVLAPHVARSPSVRELMAQAAVVGWFSLVLGLAFIARWGLRRMRQRANR